MGTMQIEVAISLAVEPSNGLRVRLVERSRDTIRVHRDNLYPGRSMTVGEWEDITAQLAAMVMDHLLVGPGVQLALHD